MRIFHLLAVCTVFFVCRGICVAAGDFSFAIVADPQVNARDSKGAAGLNAQRNLEGACAQINSLVPKPDFTVFDGDLCNTFNPPSVANFRECIKGLATPVRLVHGNHDTKPPYAEFLALQRACGAEQPREYYSFEHKGWFFIALPCENKLPGNVMSWLDGELKAHRDSPTVVFEHFPMLPTGVSQMEFYTFTIPQRKALLDALTRYGNVKYYINGHVHNGVKASEKTSWEYRGITFINAPTIISPRPFGEEAAGFGSPDTGGFFLVARTSGDGGKLVFEGRRAGSDYVYTYPAAFKKYTDDIEPRWWSVIGDMRPSDAGHGLAGWPGWRLKYRYQRDADPACVCEPAKGRDNSLRLAVSSGKPVDWADDEYNEIYKIVAVEPGKPVLLAAGYRVAQARNGGGFIRATAFDRDGGPVIFMFKWGENESNASYVPRCFGFELDGAKTTWNYLRDMGRKQRAFFVNVDATPGKENAINADLAQIYDDATGRKGAFAALGVNKLYIGAGVWVNRELGARSETVFNNIHAGEESGCLAMTTYKATGGAEFGSALDTRVKIKDAKQSKK